MKHCGSVSRVCDLVLLLTLAAPLGPGPILPPESLYPSQSYAKPAVAAPITPAEAVRIARPAPPAAEIGEDDFRISDMGLAQDTLSDVYDFPAVAYNSLNDEYLVVWIGDDQSGGMSDGEYEIWGQRLDGDGTLLGGEVRISDMGPNGSISYVAQEPVVVYNPTSGEYLVVWAGTDDSGALVGNEFEIYIQRLNAATGAEIGGDARISQMGPDGDAGYDAFSPAVAYNATDQEYLVVWHGDDDTGTLVNNEVEIIGQRLSAAGAEIGDDFRISNMGPDGSLDYRASSPAVAYNAFNAQYLVVWVGDDDSGTLVDGEFEIFGQRLSTAGADISGDFRISSMGPDGSNSYAAGDPAAAYNSATNEYLVVWEGDDNSGALVDNEDEIFGQRLNATGGALGGELRISDMGPDGSADFNAYNPQLSYNPDLNQYLVVWGGDDGVTPPGNEFEIYGQRLSATGGLVGANDFRISDIGPNGDSAYSAENPAVAYSSGPGEYLVIWRGDDDSPSLAAPQDAGDEPLPPSARTTPEIEQEFEVWGQRLDAATGLEAGTNDFRISVMGLDMRRTFDAYEPAVVYNSLDDEYLVLWWGDTLETGDGVYEIWGQRIAAWTGARLGDSFCISSMGPPGSTAYQAYSPAAAYNPDLNQYLVVWEGDTDSGTLVEDEFEIWGQRLSAAGVEIGGDFRISNMGPDGNSNYDATAPAVGYNSINDQYLVVWRGEDDSGTLVDGENEIWGQRLNAATGAEVGGDFRISSMGPDGNESYDAYEPDLEYNPVQNEYLIVWSGDDDSGLLVDGEFEIYYQRLNAATSAEIGSDFRISDMGPFGNTGYSAWNPAVALDRHGSLIQYLVVWEGNDDTLADLGSEIFGQRLNAATGLGLGANDFRISDMGTEGSGSYQAVYPAVSYSSIHDEFLVVWQGDDNTAGLVNDEFEIFGQRINGAAGTQVRSNDFRLSRMGADGDPMSDASAPVLAYSLELNQFLVVWEGYEDVYPLVYSQREIFGQRITGDDHPQFLPLVVRR